MLSGHGAAKSSSKATGGKRNATGFDDKGDSRMRDDDSSDDHLDLDDLMEEM